MISRRCSKIKAVLLFVLVNSVLILAVTKFYKLSMWNSLSETRIKESRTVLTDDKMQPRCKPKKNVVFLKTHKTGSSTVTNILSRYGDRYNLKFALPKVGYNRLGWPWFLQRDHVSNPNTTTPNILCSHSRYNRHVLEELMPNDTVYVTILRDPVTQFESTFSYMSFGKLLGLSNESDPLVAFFQNPKEILINYLLTQDLRIYSDRVKLIRNGMFFDLGLEPKDFENEEKIKGAVVDLDSQFHLVMLMEQFDESMVLLKRLLCWDLNDMLYFHLNERHRPQKRTQFSPDLEKSIRKWSSADVKLYDHFKKIFYEILSRQDEEFHNEVRSLQFRNYFLRHSCLEEQTVQEQGVYDADLKTFTIRSNITSSLRSICSRMLWDEVKYLRYLRRKQDDLQVKSWMENIPGFKWILSRFY